MLPPGILHPKIQRRDCHHSIIEKKKKKKKKEVNDVARMNANSVYIHTLSKRQDLLKAPLELS